MRQWRIVDPGDAGALELADAVTPEPPAMSVRVRTAGIGVNRADILQLRGLYPAPAGAPADVPGLEFSGRIDAVGEGVTRWAVGDRVMGLVPGGAYSESLVLPADECLPVPDGMDTGTAAAVPEPFLTAWRALDQVLDLRAGECVVVRPGTAAVGQAAAQLACWMGARVIATSRDSARLARVDPEPDWVRLTEGDTAERAEVLARVAPEGADALLDMLGGGGTMGFGLRLLRRGGRYVGLGLMAGPKEELSLGRLLGQGLHLSFMTMRSMASHERVRLFRDAENRLWPALGRRDLVAAPQTVYPFERAPEAVEHLRVGGQPGRVLLRVDDD